MVLQYFRQLTEGRQFCPLHSRQGSLPTRGTLSTCLGHPARRDNFLPRERYVSCWDIPASRGEINRKTWRREVDFFVVTFLPVLSAEQNDSQSEEINVLD